MFTRMEGGAMKVVTRCKRCGGKPIGTKHSVGHECFCSVSAWVEVDDRVLFIWKEVEV